MNHENGPCVSVVRFEDVEFSFGERPLLSDVSYSICSKDFVSIVGANGSGKTTLLKLMLGLLQPTRGKVTVFSKPPHLIRHRIGYVPQFARYDSSFPIHVIDVVLMGRLCRHKPWGRYHAVDHRAAENALRDVDLVHMAQHPFSDLSGGQRQRVLIARALAGNPDMLLLDEATANLDLEAEQRLLAKLEQLNERLTIVMVSHDLGFVTRHVKSVLCVKGTCSIHPTSEVTGELINAMYGTNMRMVRHDHRCSEEGHSCGHS